MHPILLRLPLPHFGSVPVYSYGIMLAISLIVGWFLTLGLANRDGLPREAMANCYVDTAVMALIGSRVLYLVTNPAEFTSFTSLFAMRSGGLVAYGGFLGGLLGSYLSLRFGFGVTGLVRVVSGRFGGKTGAWKPLPLLPWADVAVPSLASGLLITRIGCYLFGCDFGRPLTASAPAFLKRLGTFPRWPEGTMADGSLGSPAWDRHVRLGLIGEDADSSLPVHPTQVYESLFGLGLLIFLLVMRKHQRFRGEIFLWFAFLYGTGRFLLEIVRDDAERGNVPPALAAHILFTGCLGLLALGYAIGMAPRVNPPALRMLTTVLAFVPPVLAFVWLKPAQFENVTPIALSTSQFVGMTSGLLACAGFWVLFRAAENHPELAMALPDFTEEEEQEDDDDDDDDEKESEQKPKAEDAKKKVTPKVAVKKQVPPKSDDDDSDSDDDDDDDSDDDGDDDAAATKSKVELPAEPVKSVTEPKAKEERVDKPASKVKKAKR